MKPTLLIVDDEKTQREGLRAALEDRYDVYLAADAQSAMELLEQEHFDVLLTDFRLPSEDGMKLIKRAKSLSKPPICILMTAYGSEELAVEAMKQGADDYLAKARLQIDELELRIARALRQQNLETENVSLHQQLDARFRMEHIIGESPAMREVLEVVGQVAPARSTVLLEGESGTGKELVARALHYNSGRAKEPFVAVNCGALTESLLESELFGHMRGSFTGAFENKRGILEEATGGTVFLDEVSEMSRGLQVKLLRAIEEQEVRRVGSAQSVRVDVRFIAATNRPLDELVKQHKFREDLYYRLRVVEIEIPPLRDRSEDIPLLVDHFLRKLGQERGQSYVFSPDVLGALVAYGWPGNVRELENALESAAAVNRSGVLTPEDLPPKLRFTERPERGADDLYADLPSFDELHKRYVIYALRLCGSNKAKAADILGISRRTLYNMLDKYKLPY